MYTCPECSQQFELIVEKRVREKYLDAKEVTMTLVHQHDESGASPVWRAFVRESGERKSDVSKDITEKNRSMQKLAREKKVAEKRTEKPNKGFVTGLTEDERLAKIAQYNEWAKENVR